jgi:hypothetical protein
MDSLWSRNSTTEMIAINFTTINTNYTIHHSMSFKQKLSTQQRKHNTPKLVEGNATILVLVSLRKQLNCVRWSPANPESLKPPPTHPLVMGELECRDECQKFWLKPTQDAAVEQQELQNKTISYCIEHDTVTLSVLGAWD